MTEYWIKSRFDELAKQIKRIRPHLFGRRPNAGGEMEFLVTQTGGTAGTNQSASCTFTYSIFDAVNDPSKTTALDTVVSLSGNGNGWRGLKIVLTAGTRGRGYLGLDGVYVLTWVDEKPAGENDCT